MRQFWKDKSFLVFYNVGLDRLRYVSNDLEFKSLSIVLVFILQFQVH